MLRFILVAAIAWGLGWAPDGRAQQAASASAAVSSACQDRKPRVRAAPSPSATGVQLYIRCEAAPAASAPPAAPPAPTTAPKPATASPKPAAPSPADSAASPGRASSVSGAGDVVPGRSSTEQVAAASSAPASQPEPQNRVRDGMILLMAFAAFLLVMAGAWSVFTAIAAPKDAQPQSGESPPLPPEGFTFRRHWGSLGGESSGWNMSPRLARLLSGVMLLAVGVWMMLHLLVVTDPANKVADSKAADTTQPRQGAGKK
jgi:hypothetical protein